MFQNHAAYRLLAVVFLPALILTGLLTGLPRPTASMAALNQAQANPQQEIGSYLQEKVQQGYTLENPRGLDYHYQTAPSVDAAQALTGSIASDDFNRNNLDTSRWTFVDPLDHGQVAMIGAGTGDATLQLTAPAGMAHEPWQTNNTVRVMQTVSNGDFEVEVKYSSRPTALYQLQGIIVEQDENNWMRFELQSTTSGTRLFAAKTVNSVTTPLGTNPLVPGAATSHLKLTRSDDTWTLAYKYDGTDYGAYSLTGDHALNVSAVGPFAGNAKAGGLAAPAYTAIIDFFYDTSTPGDGDGGPVPADAIAPLLHSIHREAGEDSLTVRWNTDEAATGSIRYGETDAYGNTVTGSTGVYKHEVTMPNLVEGLTYHYQLSAKDPDNNTATSADYIITFLPNNADGPNIRVWYDREQPFGDHGAIQPWVNILGDISDPDGVSAVLYSLNGGRAKNFNLGPDGRRLQNNGDFNLDLATDDLNVGANSLMITASDAATPVVNSFTLSVTVDYQPQETQLALPYAIDWSSLTSEAEIQDIAHVVDGKWTLDELGVRTDEPGYDRGIGLGDTFWNDYEVEVPFIIHSIEGASGGNGTGVILRWNGHSDDPIVCAQPKCGYLPLGVIAWYTNGSLQLFGNNGEILGATPKALAIGVEHTLKARVETTPSGATYSLKVWESTFSEPATWDVTGQHTLFDPQRGSILLVAHNTDTSFGNVLVTAVGSGENNPPVANDDSVRVAPNGTVRINVLANDTDAGGLLDPTSVEIRTNAGKGTTAVDPETGQVTYTHDGSVGNSDTFTYRVRDDENAWSDDATVSITISDDEPVGVRSDDFSGCMLNDDMWTFVDPLDAGGAYSMIGGGTGAAHLRFTMPAETKHEMWGVTGNESLRVLQEVPDSDFQLEVHFNTLPSGGYDDQAIIVEKDENNWLRFDIFHSGTQMTAFMGSTINGSNQARASTPIPAGTGQDVRVTRAGNRWTMEYKDGSGNWMIVGSYNLLLAVERVGVAAGNTSEQAFTVDVDYFFNTDAPIDPEDGQRNTVSVSSGGNGSVAVSPEPTNGSYACGSSVTLRATPDDGYRFAQWSGDLNGSGNPATLTVKGPASILATFAEDDEREILLPLIYD